MSSQTVVIPNMLRSWPWSRHINPHYTVCKEESSAWCETFKAFDAKAQKAFDLCDFNLLASLAYPLLNKDGCRVACDLMNLFFMIDEHSDVSTTEKVQEQANTVMDAIRNPCTARPADEWIGGEMARQFWLNAIRTVTPLAQRRFVDTFQLYMNAVVQEAADRNSNYVRTVDSYLKLRRDTAAAMPCFAICEMHMNIPDEIITHPTVVHLTLLCADAITVANDVYSYNVEQAMGNDGHNLVTVVMKEYQMSIQEAMNWIGDMHDKIVDEFLETWQTFPTFGGPVDREIRTYIDGMANWVLANDCWSFESERYFGKKGAEIMRKRTVHLLAKKSF